MSLEWLTDRRVALLLWPGNWPGLNPAEIVWGVSLERSWKAAPQRTAYWNDTGHLVAHVDAIKEASKKLIASMSELCRLQLLPKNTLATCSSDINDKQFTIEHRKIVFYE